MKTVIRAIGTFFVDMFTSYSDGWFYFYVTITVLAFVLTMLNLCLQLIWLKQ